MTKEELGFLEIWFEDYLDRFRGRDGILHPMLELKRCHSARVAENAMVIAAALKLPKAEKRLAEGSGLVHDVGRFTQFARHGSFRDADTVDHGAEGRRVLEREDLSFLRDPGDRERLFSAVEYHNRNRMDIPHAFSSEQDGLLRLIRDADKLDIMEFVLRAVASDGFPELPMMLPHVQLSRDPSPEVLKEAQNTRSVSSGNLSTLGDILVMIATWFYDLNCPPTLQIAVQRDILSRIERELPETQAISDVFADITDAVLTGRCECTH
jgi:hypothetical protein